jgi:hypothetical protein
LENKIVGSTHLNIWIKQTRKHQYQEKQKMHAYVGSILRRRVLPSNTKLPCRGKASLVLDIDFVKFQLFHVLNIEAELFVSQEKFGHLSSDMVIEFISSAEKVAVKKFLSHYKRGDSSEPHWRQGEDVQIIPEVKEALDSFRIAGFYRYFAFILLF